MHVDPISKKHPTIYLNGVSLTYIASEKYLGVIVHIANDDALIVWKLKGIIVTANVLICFFKCSFNLDYSEVNVGLDVSIVLIYGSTLRILDIANRKCSIGP